MNIKLLFISLLIYFQQETDTIDIGPILEPDPVLFSFETVGWLILVVLLLIVFLIVLVKQFKLYKKNTYRREAIKRLIVIQSEDAQNHFQINQLNILLKQVAINTFGREKVATLYGKEWFEFLESTSKNTKFTSYLAVFSNAIYESKDANEKDFNTIIQLTKTWIKTHA